VQLVQSYMDSRKDLEEAASKAHVSSVGNEVGGSTAKFNGRAHKQGRLERGRALSSSPTFELSRACSQLDELAEAEEVQAEREGGLTAPKQGSMLRRWGAGPELLLLLLLVPSFAATRTLLLSPTAAHHLCVACCLPLVPLLLAA